MTRKTRYAAHITSERNDAQFSRRSNANDATRRGNAAGRSSQEYLAQEDALNTHDGIFSNIDHITFQGDSSTSFSGANKWLSFGSKYERVDGSPGTWLGKAVNSGMDHSP